jgi:hypothetical protein
LDALRKLRDGVICCPVEPLLGPLSDLLVLSIKVKGIFMELVVERRVLAAIRINYLF